MFIAYTKLAYKIKKLFEKQMKKEFPPEKNTKDELYEEESKRISKIKVPKEYATKIAKEKKPKGPNAIQALKKNNLILTPEFAHAQILQAQADILHKNEAQQTGSSIPQILPKLGIPQDILAKLSPAQMQSLIMQLRSSGTISTKNIAGLIFFFYSNYSFCS